MRLILITAIFIATVCATAQAFFLGPSTTGSTTYAPNAPTSFVGTAGNAQVSFTWGTPAVDGFHSAQTSYDLWRTAAGGGTGTESLLTSGMGSGLTSTTDSTAANGSTYYYKLKAVNAAGGTYSAEAGPYTPVNTTVYVPDVPTSLSGTAGDASVALTWTAPNVTGGVHSAATTYKLYRTAANGATGTETLLTSGISGTSTTDIGLTNGAAYRYKVLATNSAGDGSLSTEAGPYTPSGITYVINDTFASLNGSTWNLTSNGASITSGSVTDVNSGQLRHHIATTNASNWTTKGAASNALSLGSGKTVTVDMNSISSSGMVTTSFVISPTAPSASGISSDLSNQLVIAFNGGNRYVQKTNSGTPTNVVSSAAGFGGSSHTYKMVIDATNVSYYQDGSLIATTAHGLTLTTFYVWLENSTGSTTFVDALFDNVQVY